jgi:hypothetical protein
MWFDLLKDIYHNRILIRPANPPLVLAYLRRRCIWYNRCSKCGEHCQQKPYSQRRLGDRLMERLAKMPQYQKEQGKE